MALLFIDGCSHYASGDFLKKWTGYESFAPTISTTLGRRGGGALVGTSSVSIIKNIPARGTVIVGAAYKITNTFSSTRAIIEFREGATVHMSVHLNAGTNQLQVYQGTTDQTGGYTLLGTSTVALVMGTYYYLELKATIDNAVGSYTLRVNGAVEATGSGIDTAHSLGVTNLVNRVALFGPDSGGASWNACDIYIADNTGSTNNDLLGDVRIDTLFPNADGNYSQLACSTGTSHFALVDENPASLTDYVAGGVAGLKDSYALTDLTTPAAVLGVQVCNLMYKDDAGARSGANLVRSSTTDLESASVALSTSPLYHLSLHETDPATASAWTQAAVNAMEVGPVVAA